MIKFRICCFLLCTLFFNSLFAADLLTPKDIYQLPKTTTTARLYYGNDKKNQYAELRIPAGKAPHPIIILIHGGCWLSEMGNAQLMSPLASELTNLGYATWNIEYRKVGDAGGGWPGTFQDIGKGVDAIRSIASQFKLDLNRVIIIGHSAGGHLALWAAARHKLSNDSILYNSDPLLVRGVIDLAGPADLTAFYPYQEKVCHQKVISQLLGGSPSEIPAVYHDASPAALLPLRTKQIIILAQDDSSLLPPALSEQYVKDAQGFGDPATLQIINGIGHFELLSPQSKAWPVIKKAIETLFVDDEAPYERFTKHNLKRIRHQI